jgi:enoyl-CoA hydratase/carnithine racemase
MPPIPPLFALQVPQSVPPTQAAPGTGSFVCTQPAPEVYLLSFESPPDNRLTPAFNSTFALALDIIEQTLSRGVFYSNGLDFENAIKDPTFMPGSLFPLWRRLITFPMPTVALINGHAFAGGIMTAMMHDYRIMNPHKGFLCLNELEFGASLQPPMASIFRVKLGMTTVRTMILESKRYPALEALKEGMLDGVGGLQETLAFIDEYKLTQKAKSPSYGKIKEELYREVVKDLDDGASLQELHTARDLDRSRREMEAKRRVNEYLVATGGRAKL